MKNKIWAFIKAVLLLPLLFALIPIYIVMDVLMKLAECWAKEG